MRRFDLVLRFPGGGPLVGGQTAHVAGAHAVHTRDQLGRPLIPSTAIRGALRESLEALLRALDRPACMGGGGRAFGQAAGAAEAAHAGPRPRPTCTLDNGDRCLPCRLFGSSQIGLAPGETTFSSLVLEDARLASGQVGWYMRPGVAIDRARRSAREHELVFQHVPAGRDLCFVAPGRLRVPELAQEFEAAVRATSHIGAGRSRGLGHVELEVRWHDADATATTSAASSLRPPAPMTLPPDGDVHLRVTLETPALIGVAVDERNFRDTRREVPGSALRGAVGFALAELVPDASHDPAFQALVDPVQGAHFGFLHPVEAAVAAHDSADGVLGPLPITAATCKHHGRDHGIVDTLLDRLVLAHALSAEQAARPACQTRDRCARCDGPLRSATGSRRARRAPRARAVTRVSMDRARGSARDEQLFTEMLLETGTSLEGTIRNVPAHARGRLAEALGSGLLSLGRGRAMGRGRVRVEVCSAGAARPRPVIERGEAFERALVQRLAAAGFPDERARRLVPVTLLSPLDDGDGDGERLLREALGGGRCFFKARRFAREGGWDQRSGQMQPVLATAAGGVFVIELAEGARWRDIVANLEHLEQHGVGARRHQGFGQVLCFDPFFFIDRPAPASASGSADGADTRASQEHDDMDTTRRLRPHRKELVQAATSVMRGIPGDGRAGKSQLSRLAAVCNEAACADEIENYLRYQASRKAGGEGFWTLDLVDKVIAATASLRQQLSDAELVQAWRLYAVYMARAFTYESEVARSKNAQQNEPRGGRSRGQERERR